MAELTGLAFDAAQRERGPVQLNIPRDFFYGMLFDMHTFLVVTSILRTSALVALLIKPYQPYMSP
jgi:hypothetical protein